MSDPSPRLARSAGVFGLATMTSRVLGLVRDQVLSYYFGAGDAMDAFRVAFRVPNLMRDLFAEGAMSAAFVPTFTRHLTQGGKPRAFRLANSVVNALIIVTGIVVVAGIVFAGPLLRLLAGDFAEVPGKLPLTVVLTRVMLPFLTLVAMAAVLMGMLNALGHFFLPALSPAMFNVATIIMALALVPVAPALGIDPIMIVAVSTIVGGVGQLLLQWSPARAEGFRYEPRLDVRDEGLRQVLLLMVPGTIGLAATQINVFVNTILATGQGTGAVTWLDLAFRLMYLPIGLFGVSIAAATTPAVSRLVASTDREQLKTTVASGLALMLVLSVPATLGLIVLAEPIVALVFEYGNFTAADTRATAAALQFYALGLVGYSMVRIVSPTFYALQRSRVPVAASAASVAVNIGLNLVLVRVMGYRGLALGASAAAIVNGALQLWQLRRRLQGIHGRRIAVTFAQMLMASLAMAATAWATERWMESLVPGDGLPARLSRVATAIGAGVAVLGVAAHLLRVREFDEVRRTIWRRMGGRDS